MRVHADTTLPMHPGRVHPLSAGRPVRGTVDREESVRGFLTVSKDSEFGNSGASGTAYKAQ